MFNSSSIYRLASLYDKRKKIEELTLKNENEALASKRETPVEGKAHYFSDKAEEDIAEKDLNSKPKVL